jgi:hypothetical protein
MHGGSGVRHRKYDPYNPVEIHDDRRTADLRALHVYGKHAKSLGYSVTVARTPGRKRYGIYLVRKQTK